MAFLLFHSKMYFDNQTEKKNFFQENFNKQIIENATRFIKSTKNAF